MKTLVVGASGATGKLLVNQLIASGQRATVIVRPNSSYPDEWNDQKLVTVIKENITEISLDKLADIVADCHSVASCLGHNMTLKGLFGMPRRLVADSVSLLCEAIIHSASDQTVKFVLMNTAGNSNRDLNEPAPLARKIVIGLVRWLIPPHADNEKASDHLRLNIGPNHPSIEWVVVRPDNLIDDEEVTEYSLHKSPTRDPIFNPGKTSRINVGHLMARLILDNELWQMWKGQMPVIYNVAAQAKVKISPMASQAGR